MTRTGGHLLDKFKHELLNFGGLEFNFHRTCRVPQGHINELPANLGNFPLYKVADFHTGCPNNWNREGYFFPMYPQEAMWIGFSQPEVPRALIIAAGNINAISGKPFDHSEAQTKGEEKKTPTGNLEIRMEKEQNYLIVPPQPWIDGWKAEDDKVYQFVAAEMGSGETVEGQITGVEKVGGIQFIVYDPKKGVNLIHATRPREFVSGGGTPFIEESCVFYADEMCLGGGGIEEHLDAVIEEIGAGNLAEEMDFAPATLGSIPSAGNYTPQTRRYTDKEIPPMPYAKIPGIPSAQAAIIRKVRAMGLGRGGEIGQKIYPDPYGPEGSGLWKESPLEVWAEKPLAVEVFYMVSSEDFKQITGHEAPPTPVTYEVYQKYGYPWFSLHDGKYKDTKGSGIFEQLNPVGEGKAPSDPFEKLKPIVKDEPWSKEK